MSTAEVAIELAPHLPIAEIDAEGMTYEFFMENYFKPRVPVIVRHATRNWEFMHKWTRDYLTTELGDFQCTVARDSRPSYAKETCSLREYFANYSHLSTITFEGFDSQQETLPQFLKDIPLPNAYFEPKNITAYFFFHANATGGSLPHCHQDAFNLLQLGTKRWAMYDADPELAPQGWAALKRCHEKYAQGTFSRDWFVDGPTEVRKQGITVYEGEQRVGDMMFIPEHFSHAVLNMSETQGMVVITGREGKEYQCEEGSGYSPNSAQQQ